MPDPIIEIESVLVQENHRGSRYGKMSLRVLSREDVEGHRRQDPVARSLGRFRQVTTSGAQTNLHRNKRPRTLSVCGIAPFDADEPFILDMQARQLQI